MKLLALVFTALVTLTIAIPAAVSTLALLVDMLSA